MYMYMYIYISRCVARKSAATFFKTLRILGEGLRGRTPPEGDMVRSARVLPCAHGGIWGGRWSPPGTRGKTHERSTVLHGGAGGAEPLPGTMGEMSEWYGSLRVQSSVLGGSAESIWSSGRSGCPGNFKDSPRNLQSSPRPSDGPPRTSQG